MRMMDGEILRYCYGWNHLLTRWFQQTAWLAVIDVEIDLETEA
jgi:hypothetical protein